MTIDAMNQALQGIQDSRRRFESAGGDVTRATTTDASEPDAPDLADASVRLLTARRGLEACLAVARSADEMVGKVIDTLA